MNTRTVTIELAWRVETIHEVEIPYEGGVYPHDGNDDPQSLQEWLRGAKYWENIPDAILYAEAFDLDTADPKTGECDEAEVGTVTDCYVWQIKDNETGEWWRDEN
tara:strand:+ start:1252 stop:1566 length:315 start_codon:yes stop_codon:yes gene_type:complete